MTTDREQGDTAKRAQRIARDDYARAAKELRHVFLTGDLRLPTSYPYFRDQRVELIFCDYQPGDDGRFHWHAAVSEYAFVISGRVGIKEAVTGEIVWHDSGDVSHIPAGVCVQRLVPEAAQTIALKVPSRPGDKVHCADCERACKSRVAEFRGVPS